MILQKIISTSGYCSRRQAEKLIRGGAVKVNGQRATIGDQADLNQDQITIKNHPLATAEEKIYIKLNKPAGYTCTNRKFDKEKNIFDLVNIKERVFTVGRLDKDSRGLILLTNDGDLTQRLTHPKFQHLKVYEVKVRGKITNLNEIKEKFLKGIIIGDKKELARAKKIEYLQKETFVVSLSEGKKRQLRLMFRAFNLEVKDLKRIQIANLEIKNLSAGTWKYLTPEEIRDLKK